MVAAVVSAGVVVEGSSGVGRTTLVGLSGAWLCGCGRGGVLRGFCRGVLARWGGGPAARVVVCWRCASEG